MKSRIRERLRAVTPALWHEAQAEVSERLRIARRARSLGELLRDQWDLLPMSQARLRRHGHRRSPQRA